MTSRKYVVSTSLQEPEWNNTRVIKVNVVDQIAALKQQPGMDILVNGSGQLLRTLMEHNLVDEYRLMLHPIVVGSGKRLFQNGVEKSVLKLVRTQPFDSGIVVLTYEPAKQAEQRATAG